MPGGIRLDIDPKSWSKIPEEIRCEDDNFPGTYDSYKYYSEPGKGKPFTLSAILYNGEFLPGILPYPISVKAVSTYFNGNKTNILLIHIALSSGTNWYCANPDTDVNVKHNTFTRFLVDSSEVLDTNDIENILQNVETHNGFSIAQFGSNNNDTATKLVGENDIIFDPTKKPISDYNSEVSGTKVTVTPGSLIGGTFKKAEHTANSCSIRGIKLSGGQYMRVAGGFPNDLITGFYVYYKDSDYTTPLLVELKLDVQAMDFVSYVPTRYLLSKNTEKSGEGKEWDIRKIGSYIEGGEVVQVLQNISENSKLDVDQLSITIQDKLGDISKGVIVDLIGATEASPDFTKFYNSDGVRIPYKTLKSNAYYVVRQPYFPSFILKSIKTESGSDITGKNLPPPGTEIWQLNVYCKNAYKEPVLIEVICKYEQSDGCPKYVYYYCKDGSQWVGYLLSTTVGEDKKDIPNVIKHVKENDGKIDLTKLEESLKSKLTKYTPDKEQIYSQGGNAGLSEGTIAGYTAAGVGATGSAIGLGIWKGPALMSFLITRM